MALPAWLGELLAGAGDDLARVLQYPLNASQRLYFYYLLSALALGFVVLLWRYYRRRGVWRPGRALKQLLSPRIWWHPSARLDYLLFLFNPLIRGVLLAGGLTMVPVALAVSDGLGYLGAGEGLQLTALQLTALFTVSLFVADDFTRYWLHRALHRVPMLWALHRLHHSAEVLTPVTVYRMHPLESALYALRMVVTQGAVVGVFFFFFGMGLSAWQVAGANFFTWAFNLAGANLRHSHVWLSWGALERLFISPAQHQIHHSDQPRHFDRNFGSFLAIWDGLFGTWVGARGQRVTGFGLGRDSPHRSLWQAWWEPLAAMARALRPKSGAMNANAIDNRYHSR